MFSVLLVSNPSTILNELSLIEVELLEGGFVLEYNSFLSNYGLNLKMKKLKNVHKMLKSSSTVRNFYNV